MKKIELIKNITAYMFMCAFLIFGSCKNKASYAMQENEEKFDEVNEDLVDQSRNVVTVTDYVLTGIQMSDIILQKVDNEEINALASFIHERNTALAREIDTVVIELGIINIKKPSELMQADIDKIKSANGNLETLAQYNKWLDIYSEKLKSLSLEMIQESDHERIIKLGTKINAYGNALERERAKLDNVI